MKVRTETAPAYTGELDQLDTDLIERTLAHIRQVYINRAGPLVSNSWVVKDYLAIKLAAAQHEIFGVILLDTGHRIIGDQVLFHGTVDGAAVYPREVVKCALRHNAAALICYHNHPSGRPEPSRDDIAITRRLKDALTLVDIRLLDHIITGGGDTVSLADRGSV